MVDVAASPVVAAVTEKETAWNSPARKLPGNAVDFVHHAVNPDDSVSGVISPKLPLDATGRCSLAAIEQELQGPVNGSRHGSIYTTGNVAMENECQNYEVR